MILRNSKIKPPGTLATIPSTSEANFGGSSISRGKWQQHNGFNRNGKRQKFKGVRLLGNTQVSNFRGNGGGRWNQAKQGGFKTKGNNGKGRIMKNQWSKPSRPMGTKNPAIICFLCGTKGHPKRLYRIPEHLARIYQKYKSADQQESHGTFLESSNNLEAYTRDETMQSEAHMILEQPTMQLDDLRTCIVDSGTSHTILQYRKYFSHITPSHRQMTTIMGNDQIEEGHGPATIILPQDIVIRIKSVIFAPNATMNLISFKDIRVNGYHIHTNTEKTQEVIHIVSNTDNGMEIKKLFLHTPWVST